MWNWFGGQSAVQKRKDAPKKAILDLRQQLDMLQKRERHLENQMAAQDKIARDNVTANKTGTSVHHTLRIPSIWRSGLLIPRETGLAASSTEEDAVKLLTVIWLITTVLNSRSKCAQAEKTTRALSRADSRPDTDAGAADILDRIGQHQSRNTGRHEECRQSHERDPWQDDHGGR